MLQPGASLRPVITNRSCTLPLLTPSLVWKRASRIGPLGAMNHGTAFFAPLSVATAIRGFWAGLVPPILGCEWQEKHWLELKRGPSPLFEPPWTASIAANLTWPSRKNVVSSAVRPANAPPAPAGPPRTPGSTGLDLVWPKVQVQVSNAIVKTPPKPLGIFLVSIIIPSPPRDAEFLVLAMRSVATVVGGAGASWHGWRQPRKITSARRATALLGAVFGASVTNNANTSKVPMPQNQATIGTVVERGYMRPHRLSES